MHRLILSEKNIPDIPKMGREVMPDTSPPLQTRIKAEYKELFNKMIDLPARKEFIYNLKEIEFQIPVAVIGMKFNYTFEDLQIEVEPIHIKAEENAIFYAECHNVPGKNLNYVLHFTVSKSGDNQSYLSLHVCPAPGTTLSQEQRRMITSMQDKSMKKLKELVE